MEGKTVVMDHIAMYVNDLEAARDFFVEYLGAASNAGYHNPATGFRSYFLSFDGGARIEVMNRPLMDDGAKSPLRTGYAHVSFSVGGRDKVDALTARLKAAGYRTFSGPRVTGDGYYESCVLGIEGNLIEIVA